MTEILKVDFINKRLTGKEKIVQIKELPQFLYHPEDSTSKNRFDGECFIGWKENSDVTDELTRFLAKYDLQIPKDEQGNYVLPDFLHERDGRIFLPKEVEVENAEVSESWNDWLQDFVQ